VKVGIVGGGLMGLALSQKLSEQGHQAIVFESADQPGGLATYHDYDGFFWDRFYHVILPGDSFLLDFIRDIGLGDKLRWSHTRTGFYVDRNFYSVSNNLEFLRFPLLTLFEKVRFVATTLYCSRLKDWEKLEEITVEDWLKKMCGAKAFEKMWKPLLLAKLGENYKQVSAIFIWTYIKRVFEARDSSAQKEHLGYVVGGYKVILERITRLIEENGGKVQLNATVENILPAAQGVDIVANNQTHHFEKVIFTGPVNSLLKVTNEQLFHYKANQASVDYLGVVCMVMITDKPLTPYYVLNIADSEIPFTGVIGMTTVVSTDQTSGCHLTYLPRYVSSNDPLLQADDEEIKQSFMAGLQKMYPDFRMDIVRRVYVNRAFKVQPLQKLNYSKSIPSITTKHPDFYVLNNAQFINGTLNNNNVIEHALEFLENHKEAFLELRKSQTVVIKESDHKADECVEENCDG